MSSVQLAPNASIYIEQALDCLQKVSFSTKPILLSRIAMGLKTTDAKKASEVFQQAFSCALQSKVNNSTEREALAEMIHFMLMEQSFEEAKNVIASLNNSFHGCELIIFYLSSYGKKDCPLTEFCIEKFKQWNVTSEHFIMQFASACSNFDFDYFLETLNTIKDPKVRAEKIISVAELNIHQINQTVIDSYLDLIDKAIQKEPNDITLKMIKVKLSLLRGEMTMEEIEAWISVFKVGAKKANPYCDPRNVALMALAKYLKMKNFKRAIEVSLMCADPHQALKKTLTPLTPERFEVAEPFIAQIEDDDDRVQNNFHRADVWLFIASELVNDYPEVVHKLHPKLVAMIESCPDEKVLYWEPGMGKKRDAYIGYRARKRSLMHSAVRILLTIKALDEVEKLKNHSLFELDKFESSFHFKCMMAEYYTKKDPKQAEEHYNEALRMIEGLGDYKWDPLRRRIAEDMFQLNPHRSIEIIKKVCNSDEQNQFFLNRIKATAKSDRKLAEICFSQMGASDLSSKTDACLELIWA